MNTWVLLRGLTREHGHWGEFPGQLARTMPGAQVVMLDLPGAGVLCGVPSPTRVEDLMEACRAQLRQQGVAPPFHVLGLSLGGMVAAAWVAAWPAELRACVLVNTSMRPYHRLHQRLRPARFLQLLSILLDANAQRAEESVLHLTSNFVERHRAVLEHWVHIRKTRPVSRGNAVRQLLAAARYRHGDGRPQVPMLLAASAGDRLVDPACTRILAKQWRARFVMHPGAGHDLPLDDGPWLAREIASWVAKRFQTTKVRRGTGAGCPQCNQWPTSGMQISPAARSADCGRKPSMRRRRWSSGNKSATAM